MKFTIERSELLRGLQRIGGIADPRGTMPVLANILIDAVGFDSISISATDLEISFRGTYKAKIESVGAITVHAKKLFDIVKELQGGKISFTTEDNNWVTIVCNDSRFHIPGLPAEEFPAIPSIDDEKDGIEVGFNSFKADLKKIIFSVSQDTTRNALMGALFEIEGNKIKMVATDGHRLAYVEKGEVVNDANVTAKAIIPKKTLSELIKAEDSVENMRIFFVDNYVFFRQETEILISRIIDAEFPEYSEVLPDKCNHRISFNKVQLLHALRRVSVLADEQSKTIKFELKNNLLTLVSDTAGFGEARETIAVVYEGSDMVLGLNAAYMLEVLSLLSDEVYVDIIDSTSATLVGCPKNIGYKYVIMPVRIRTAEPDAEDN